MCATPFERAFINALAAWLSTKLPTYNITFVFLSRSTGGATPIHRLLSSSYSGINDTCHASQRFAALRRSFVEYRFSASAFGSSLRV